MTVRGATQGSAREFWADNTFYDAAGQDDGSSEAAALRRAEASLAEIKPALTALIEAEVRALLARLDALSSLSLDTAQIDDIGRSTERIIDVAATLGFPHLSRVARGLRQACRAIDADTGSVETLTSHRDALRACVDPRLAGASS